MAKVRFDKLIATTFGSIEHGGTPFLGTILHPIVELISDLPQHIPAYRILIPIHGEETHDSLGLLERLDEAVEQNPIKARISESNAILVMLLESLPITLCVASRTISASGRIAPLAGVSQFANSHADFEIAFRCQRFVDCSGRSLPQNLTCEKRARQ
jgi:hypothetical protein